ncbi:hypothetical protein Rhal01_02496 [Rubritalea halochordaticola]|uniref:Outer membrane lipoprotein-sorting protein n=1 Tax=Rubritalea halochordaticola TaxID=714537 RepID=A0ABP9V0W7_9BACT
MSSVDKSELEPNDSDQEGVKKPAVHLDGDGQPPESVNRGKEPKPYATMAESGLSMRRRDPDASLLQAQRPVHSSPEEQWGGEEQKSTDSWILGIVCTIFGLLGVAILWSITNLDHGSEKAEVEQAALEVSQEQAEQVQLNAEEIVGEVERLTRGYVEAKSVDERAKYVRDSERVRPLMNSYYEDHPLETGRLKSIKKWLPVEMDHYSFLVITYELEGEKGSSQLLIGESEQGVMAVDWESKVSYQTADWDKFRKEKVAEPTMFRVYLELTELSPFYGFEFSDYKKYRAYKVMLKDEEEYLWGYTELDSPVDQKLMQMAESELKATGKMNKLPVIVKLRYLKNSMSDRCVVIDELVGKNWVLTNPDKQLK